MIHPQAEEIWCNDWPVRHLERLKAYGITSVHEFLSRYPKASYSKLSQLLGGFIAPMQLQRLQFDESKRNNSVKEAAQDMLVRIIRFRLKRGWNRGGHRKLNRAGAYSDFLTQLCIAMNDPTYEPLTKSVWDALEAQNPDDQWIPIAIDDPLIQKAFEIGWPEH